MPLSGSWRPCPSPPPPKPEPSPASWSTSARCTSSPPEQVPVRASPCLSLLLLSRGHQLRRPSNFPPPAHSGKSAAGQALSLTGSAPAPCPGGQATGLDSSTARYTVTPPRLRSPPRRAFPLSVRVRPCPSGARGRAAPPLPAGSECAWERGQG